MTDKGAELLRSAIYKRAILDYYEALITHNDNQIAQLETFFTSGAYYIKINVGEYIIKKCKEELKLVEAFVAEFLKSKESSIKIEPAKISPPVIKMYVNYKFSSYLTIREINDELYLILKKPLKMA